MACLRDLVFLCSFAVSTVVITGDECPYKGCSCDSVQILCQSKKLTTIERDNNVSDVTQTMLFLDKWRVWTTLEFKAVKRNNILRGVGEDRKHWETVVTDASMVVFYGAHSVLLDEVNLIRSIPAGSLLPNLTEISLSNNPITTIDKDAFSQSATTLETLTFSEALFTRIPDALSQLRVLVYFSVHDTHIQDWNQEVMINIGRSVRQLYLGNVGLTTWPLWIQYFLNLTELSISDTTISSIPANAFNSVVHSLTKLSVTNNNLTALPRALSQLYRMQSLAVEGAAVDDVLWLPLSANMESLSLANNNLSNAEHVSNNLRRYDYSLKHLDLQGNKFTSVLELSFMINLQDVSLNRNNIYLPDIGSLPARISNVDLAINSLPLIPHFLSELENVWYLNLPQNSITELRGEDYPPATIVADFGFNLITNLTDASFPEDSNITILSLNNNPIVSISIHAFRNLANLSLLNLQFSKLTRLPLAVSSLSHLSTFDISGSVDLVCTCAERSIGPVILSTSTVNGTCGDTSIQYFFTNLVSGCTEF